MLQFVPRSKQPVTVKNKPVGLCCVVK